MQYQTREEEEGQESMALSKAASFFSFNKRLDKNILIKAE